jgi:hypothetical protein
MRLAVAKPMRVKRILAKTMAEEFVALAPEYALGFSDGQSPDESGKRSLKRYENNNGVTKRNRIDVAGPQFFEMISKDRPDLVMTGGHASDIRWEMGYGYQDDIMQRDSKTGKPVMYDRVESKNRGEVVGSDQRIFWSPGSCLWTRVKEPSKSLMFALIRHAGDVQHFGAAHVTWHGFIGGGMRDPLVTTTQNPTFFEALTYSRVAAEYERNKVEDVRDERELGPQLEVFGKTWDLAGFTGIGDPALDARLERVLTHVPELETKVDSSSNGLNISIKALKDLNGCERPTVITLPRGTTISGRSGTNGLVYEIVGRNRYAVVEIGRELEERDGQLKYKMTPVKKGTEFTIELKK